LLSQPLHTQIHKVWLDETSNANSLWDKDLHSLLLGGIILLDDFATELRPFYGFTPPQFLFLENCLRSFFIKNKNRLVTAGTLSDIGQNMLEKYFLLI
jgi:hypothetical protein